MSYYYNPQVNYLLKKQSTKKVEVSYSELKLQQPEIGPRPPYYAQPSYKPYYPTI